jgi:hypothetical protein
MLYSEIIAVCSEIHTKYINTLCGQKLEIQNVKTGCTVGFKGLKLKKRTMKEAME